MPGVRLPRLRRQQPPPPPPEDPELIDDAFDEEEDGSGARMGFFDHLNELRIRLFRAALALVLGTLVGVGLAAPALEYLRTPYCQVVALNRQAVEAGEGEEIDVDAAEIDTANCQFQLLDPTAGIVAYFRVSVLLGAIIAIPMMTYQVLMFILPGLTRKEKRIVLMSLPAITALFLIGVGFSWFVLMPPALGFLEGFQQNLFRAEWTADGYLGFVTSLLFWMGVAFETPLVFFVLGLLGLVGTWTLIHNWRIAIIAAAVAAAFITPTVDPVNMFLVMGPLLALYVLSIFLVFIARRISRVAGTLD